VVLADQLTRRGIAVLRYDGRGEGASTGDPLKEDSTADLVADALAGVAYLKMRPEIDARGLGVLGSSWHGGVIATQAAVQSGNVAFVIELGGVGVNGAEVICLRNDNLLRLGGASEQSRARTRRINEELTRIAQETTDAQEAVKKFELAWTKELSRLAEQEKPPYTKSFLLNRLTDLLTPWDHFFLTHDPLPTLRKVSCPVLIVTGGNDLILPPKDNLPKIAQALREGGNQDCTVKELPGLNHMLQTARTGHHSEYDDIEETIAPAALDLISGWILQRFGRTR
jgi:dienelactone hydrolase